jgi:hypothetical protein
VRVVRVTPSWLGRCRGREIRGGGGGNHRQRRRGRTFPKGGRRYTRCCLGWRWGARTTERCDTLSAGLAASRGNGESRGKGFPPTPRGQHDEEETKHEEEQDAPLGETNTKRSGHDGDDDNEKGGLLEETKTGV